MKGKLFLLLGIAFVPLALTAQTTPYLYNKGTMSVVTNNNQNTALYIGGDFVSETTGTMVLEKAKVVLTGDLYRNSTVTPVASTAHVFNVNNYIGYNVPGNRSSLWFQGTTAQNVWKAEPQSPKVYNDMNFKEKAENAIYFPDIVVNNKNHVTIHPEIGASAYDIKPITGRLILDSRKFDSSLGDKLPDVTGGKVTLHSDATSSILAHLLVKGKQDMTGAFNTAELGKWAIDAYPGVQVNLAVGEPLAEAARPAGDAIFGMGVPFSGMRADYFMFNFLFMPSGNSIFNADGNTSVDPLLELQPGQGFVVGIDLRGGDAYGANYKDIHPFYYNNNHGYKINFGQRVKNKYQFNRFAYGNRNYNNLFQVNKNYTTTLPIDQPVNDESIKPGINVQPSASTAYTKETLNSTDISRKLVKGFNYLSNPFTTPIDVSPLVFVSDPSVASSVAGWGITVGYTSGVSLRNGVEVGEIANRVWVMDPSSVASGTYNIWAGGTTDNPGNKWVVAHYRYRLISHIGSTSENFYDNGGGTTVSTPSSALIAPLQMFLIYANKAAVDGGKSITIPASARTVEDNALFLRSTGDNKYEPDDFLFEVTDLDKGTTDRAAIVLRSFSEINKQGYLDVKKLTTDVSSNETAGTTRAATSEGIMKTSAMSALYTKDSDGNAIESKFLALDLNAPATSTILYLQPSLTKHDITIRSFRNFTKDKITEVILEDLLTNKTIELSGGATYTTSSSPTDDPARFRVTFKYSPVGGIGDDNDFNSDQTNITAYYKDNTLTVSGFNDSDYGSQVSVYDLQGRLIKQRKVDGTSVVFNDGFNVGAYIVKVTGSRSYATKFLAR